MSHATPVRTYAVTLATQRAVVYCRVSTDDQQDNGTSLDSQLDACLKRARERGYVVDPHHVFSGWESAGGWRDRKLLQHALDVIREEAADVFICYAVDRLSRRQAHTAIISEIIQIEHGAKLEFITEEFEDSIVGEFIRNAKAFAAEIELEKIRERTVRGKQTRLKSGKLHNHGSDLYGYRRDKERGVREIYEPEADLVRDVFQAVLAGVPVRSLVRRLNASGTPSPSVGKLTFADGRTPRWGTGVIYRMLAEPAYKGETNAWRWRSGGRNKSPQLRSPDEWIGMPAGTTPSIVSPDEWEAVQDRLRTQRGARTRNEVRQYLLRGMVVCGTCGRPMRSCPERNTRVYRCSSRERGPACGGRRVPAEPVEAWVWEEVRRLLNEPDLIARETSRLLDSETVERLRSERKSIERRIKTIEGQQQSLMRELRERQGTKRLFELARAEIDASEAERQQHLSSLAGIVDQIEGVSAMAGQLGQMKEFCAQVSERIEHFGFDEKRKTLEALGIVVTGDGRSWSLKGGIPLDGQAGISSTTSWRNVRRHGPPRRHRSPHRRLNGPSFPRTAPAPQSGPSPHGPDRRYPGSSR